MTDNRTHLKEAVDAYRHAQTVMRPREILRSADEMARYARMVLEDEDHRLHAKTGTEPSFQALIFALGMLKIYEPGFCLSYNDDMRDYSCPHCDAQTRFDELPDALTHKAECPVEILRAAALPFLLPQAMGTP